MAIQADGRLLPHAVSISGQTDYDFVHSMKPSRLAEKQSKEYLENPTSADHEDQWNSRPA